MTFIKRYGNEVIKIFFIFISPISCCVCISLTSKPTYLSQKNLKSLRKTFICVILCSVVNLRKFFLNDVELLFVLQWKRAKILKSIYVQHSNWTSNMTCFYRPMVHSQQTIRFFSLNPAFKSDDISQYILFYTFKHTTLRRDSSGFIANDINTFMG